MKKFLFLQLIILSAFFAACNKDQMTEMPSQPDTPETAADPRGQSAPMPRLTSISYSLEKLSPILFGYEGKGRLNMIDEGEDSTNIVFKSDSVFIKEFRKAENRFVFDFKGKMDNKGRVVSGQAQVSYNINFPHVANYSFQYNIDGYMTNQLIKRSNNTDTEYFYTYQNGDLKEMRVYRDGLIDFSIQYDYHLNMTDKTGVEMNKFYPGHNGLSGKTNKHLVKMVKGMMSNGTVSWTQAMTFHLDAKGYPDYADVQSSAWGDYKMFYQY